MDDEPIKDLATRAFQKRVLDEFAGLRRDFGSELSAIRSEQAELRQSQAEMRAEIAEIRVQQTAMAKDIAAFDQRLTALERRVDERLQETRPIWERVEEQLQRIMERFEGVILEFAELRHDMKIYGRRIGNLESRGS